MCLVWRHWYKILVGMSLMDTQLMCMISLVSCEGNRTEVQVLTIGDLDNNMYSEYNNGLASMTRTSTTGVTIHYITYRAKNSTRSG